MKNWFCRRAIVLAVVLFVGWRVYACSWAIGYFHQVTQLRGTVVGMHRGWPRWLRLHVTRGNVNLRLYEYRWPVQDISEMPLVKTAKTDNNGWFDFGNLPEGHYKLVIDWPVEYGNLFDVEIKKLPQPTISVKIDVTLNFPDCTGGHEFLSF